MVSQANSSSMLSLLRCGVGGATYGLEMSWVRSILRSDQLRATGGSDGLAGHVSGPKGNIPVYRLADRLGQTGASRSELQHIVVLHDDRQSWGLLIDHVSQAIRVPAADLLPLPAFGADLAQAPFLGVLQLNRELLLLLDPTSLSPQPANAPRRDAGLPRTRAASHRATRPQGNNQQLILFSTVSPTPGQRPLRFGLSLAQIQEVLEPLPMTPVPGVPESFRGLVNWRRQPVMVMDLDKRLGLPARPAIEQPRLLIAQAPKSLELLGFQIQSAVRVMRLPVAHQVRSEGLPLNSGLILGAIELLNETVVIPNLSALLQSSRAIG